jgi:hypothetical protein
VPEQKGGRCFDHSLHALPRDGSSG